MTYDEHFLEYVNGVYEPEDGDPGDETDEEPEAA